MDDSKLRFGVGVLVIAAIGVGVILTFLFGAFPAILNSEYTISVSFESAQGINTNTPVTRDGYKIGRVADIQLQEEGGVRLTLAIDAEHRMTHRYLPQIGIGSLITGDSKLEFKRADAAELANVFKDNLDMIDRPYTEGEHFTKGKKLADPFTLLFGMEDELRDTFRSIRGAGDAVQDVSQSIDSLFRDVRSVIGVSGDAAGSSMPPGNSNFPSSHRAMPMPGMQAYLPAAPAWARPLVIHAGHPVESARQTLVQTVAFQNQPAPQNQPTPFNVPQGTRPTLTDLTDEAIQTLAEFQGAIRDARQIFGNEAFVQNLNDSAARLPLLLDEGTATLQTARDTFDSFRNVGEQFEQVGKVAEEAVVGVQETLQSFQGTARNVERFTEPFADRGGEFADSALRSLADFDDVLVQVNTFVEMLNNSDGTLRRLIEDDESYDEFRRTLQNIEAITARARPIMDDIRVFTDKIARDPRQLGIRGAIGQRPTGMGLK